MNKPSLLKIVNPALGIVFFAQALTGVFHDAVTEISYGAFKTIHGLGGYLLVILVLTHVYLNWSWIKNSFMKRIKS